MPRWQNLTHPHQEKFIRGYSVYAGGGCGSFPHFYDQIEGFGSHFKRDVKRYYPAPFDFLIQAPSLPSPNNFLDLDPEVKDIYGIPVARFHFQWGPNELLMWEHCKQVCADLVKAAGGEIWGAGDDPFPPGQSLHETGPCRFGKDPRKFVTNGYSQCHDVPNLYICDASVFPFATDKTSTISIMAFTLRTCEFMIEMFRRGRHST
jgi:choline dehydrogenase-like flavoprotein